MTRNFVFATGIVALTSALGAPALAQATQKNSSDAKLDSPFAAFRLGAILSPVASVDGGLDVTFPRLRIGEQWVSRLDFDASARFKSPSFGSRRDAELAITFDQVYTPGGVNRGRFYVGVGIGQTVGRKTGISGKVFGGININRVFSIEVVGQLPPSSSARLALMGRLAAL